MDGQLFISLSTNVLKTKIGQVGLEPTTKGL